MGRLSSGGILIFSAAQPGQYGSNDERDHLGARPLGFWRYELTRRGLRYMPDLTHAIVTTSMHNFWNRMIFVGREALSANTPQALGISWQPNLCPNAYAGWC